jgi:hypothetical protein
VGEHGRSLLLPLIQGLLAPDLDSDRARDEVELFNPHAHGGDALMLEDDGGNLLGDGLDEGGLVPRGSAPFIVSSCGDGFSAVL